MAKIYLRTRKPYVPDLATDSVSHTAEEEDEEEQEEEELDEEKRNRRIAAALRRFDIQERGWSTILLHSEMSMTAPSEARPSHNTAGQLPYIPPEIQSRILSYLHIHDGPVLLRPKHSRDKMYTLGIARDSPDGAYVPDDLYKRTPTLAHTAPSIDLLLVNKFFHEECTKHFYNQNSLTILDYGHLSDMLRLLDDKKRTLVHHVTFEALAEVDRQLWIDDEESWIFTTVNRVWGLFGLTRLNRSPSSNGLFPNLKSITMRLRYRRKDWAPYFAPTFRGPAPIGGITSREDKEMLERLDLEGTIEEAIAYMIAYWWEQDGLGYQIPMINLSFLFDEMEEWDDRAPSKPLLSFERVRDGSYKGKTE